MDVILVTLITSVWMNVKLGYEVGALSLDEWYARAQEGVPATSAARLISPAETSSWTDTDMAWCGGFVDLWDDAGTQPLCLVSLSSGGLSGECDLPDDEHVVLHLLGWICKGLIMRFGGDDSYRRVRPAFIGLALGDVVMMVLWLVIDGWLGRTGHKLGPG
jgi:hypothetical protein